MTAESITVTEVWLRAEGVSKAKARQFRDFSADAVAHEWQAEIPPRGSLPEPERQKRIGGLLDRWEVRPPIAPSPVALPRDGLLSEQEAQRRAQAIALADTSEQELALLAGEIWAGASDDQALDYLASWRVRQVYLAEGAAPELRKRSVVEEP